MDSHAHETDGSRLDMHEMRPFLSYTDDGTSHVRSPHSRAETATASGFLDIEISPTPDTTPDMQDGFTPDGQSDIPLMYRRFEDHRTNRDIPEAEKAETDFDPIDVPPGYPPLDYRPAILGNWFLGLSLVFFSGCLAGLITLLLFDRRQPDRLHTRLSSYHTAGRYAPAIVGSITVTWWRAISRSYFRILPYMMMAAIPPVSDGTLTDRASRIMDVLGDLAYSDFYLYGTFELMRQGYGMTTFIQISAILTTLFVAPLKSSLIQTTKDETGWAMDVSGGVAAILIGIYALMVLSVALILIRFNRQSTGLKWEPASLAAQVTLLRNLNCREAFTGSEYCTKDEANKFAKTLGKRYGTLRLGYWRHRQNGSVVHGIRFIKAIEGGRDLSHYTIDKFSDDGLSHPCHRRSPRNCHQSIYDTHEAPIDTTGRTVCSPEYVRHASVYLWTSDFFLLFIGIVGLICLTVSIFHIANGTLFKPFVSHVGTYFLDNFSRVLVVIIIYSFLPAFLFMLFSNAFFSADLQYRSTQALHELSTPRVAEKSLLLDYLSPDPVSIIFKAMSNKHYLVAWQSLVALLTTYSVVVAGGIFSGEAIKEGFRLTIVPINFWASFAILSLYLLILLFARPPVTYRSPRTWLSSLDTISFVYDSPILSEPEFEVDDKTDEERHYQSRIILSKRKFCFGMYLGVGGRRHLGISPSEIKEGGSEVKIVDQIEPGRLILGHFWKRPRIRQE